MKKLPSVILGLVLFASLSLPLAVSAGTYECACYFVLTGGDCTKQDDLAARGSGVTTDSNVAPVISNPSDANPTDPQLAKCKTDGCPSPQGSVFCKLEWIPKSTIDGVKDGTLTPDSVPDTGAVKLTNPLKVTSVPELVANILKAGIGIVGALALLIFIYGGLRWLTSAGEPAKIQAGKDAMKWAAIGLIVIFSSYTLVNFVLQSIKG